MKGRLGLPRSPAVESFDTTKNVCKSMKSKNAEVDLTQLAARKRNEAGNAKADKSVDGNLDRRIPFQATFNIFPLLFLKLFHSLTTRLKVSTL